MEAAGDVKRVMGDHGERFSHVTRNGEGSGGGGVVVCSLGAASSSRKASSMADHSWGTSSSSPHEDSMGKPAALKASPGISGGSKRVERRRVSGVRISEGCGGRPWPLRTEKRQG